MTHTASGGGYDSVTASLTVFVRSPGLIAPASLSFLEGSRAEYQLYLNAQPGATVTVTISGHAGTSLTLDKTSLTFTTSNWNTPQRVTVRDAGDQDTSRDRSFTLTHTAAGGGFDSVTKDLQISVPDGDRDGVVVSHPDVGGLRMEMPEGSVHTLRVRLGRAPTGTVTVSTFSGGGQETDAGQDEPDLHHLQLGNLADRDADRALRCRHAKTTFMDSVSTQAEAASTGATTVTAFRWWLKDNGGVPTLSVPSASRVSEGDAQDLTVRLSRAVDRSDVTFQWQTADGSATAGSDYTAQAETSVTIPAGSTSATVRVQTTEDTVVEGDETFTASISADNLPLGIGLDDDSTTTTVTIADDDTATLRFDPATVTVTEAGTATFTVKLTQEVASDVTFTWQTADGSATAGSDYSAQAETSVTIPAGSTSATLEVPTTADTVVEGDETFTATFSAGSLPTGVALGTATATATIDDDDTATLGFDPDTATATEGGTVAFTVKLTKEADSDVTFTWQTADGSATAGSDYSAQAETSVTIPAGSTSATLEVPTTADTVVEGDETFTASISATNLPSGITLGTATSATATIDDDDTATLGFDPAAASVTEGGTVSLTVKLTREADSAVTFTWQTADGSATASDYSAQTPTPVTIPAGSTSATLEVQTTADTVVEGDETFTASISADSLPDGVTLGTATSATVTIDDDDTATLGFDPAAASVTEGGTVSLTVKLTKEADSDVTFTWQTADGSATAGSDYTAQAETSVTIPAGSTSATLHVQTTPDTVVEGDETFTASISADTLPNRITLGTATSATATIDDDDTATLGFDPPAVSVTEGGTVSLTVKLTKEADSDVTFTWQTADDSATASDYSAQTPTAVTIPAGSTSATLEVQTTADTVVEGDETFTATISADNLPSGVTLGTATATATIDDDDGATLRFDPATVTVTEGGSATFTVKLSLQVASDVTFKWQTADDSATAGSDYTPQAETSVTIAAGDTSATLEVQTTPDSVVEGDETFTASISAANLPAGVTLGTATATATIDDDDTATLGFDPVTVTVTEGGSATFTVKLTQEADSDVTFTWQTADDSATAGSDYTAQAETSVTIPAGSTSATLHVQTTPDLVVEGDETFTASIGAANLPAGVTLGTSTATATIHDDDTATLGFDPATVTVTEGSKATFTVELTAAASSGVTFTWQTANGTATAVSDYTAQVETSVTIPAGSTSATLIVQTTADAVVEGDETFTASISATNLPSGITLGTATSATATIDDDDTATIGFDPATVTVTEGGTAALTVKLTKEADSDVTFTWQTADDSATAGSDYTAQAETSVTIAAGDTSATLEVQTTPDTVVEGDETFTASISADSLPDGITLGTATSATATIDDDDTAMLRFDPATVTVTEGGTAAFTVKLTQEADSDVTFTWQTADDSATAGSDYTAQAETSVTIPAGDTSATLEVQTTPDLVVEGDETFTASISADSLPSGVSLGTVAGNALIIDDDTATLRLDPATVTVTEGGTAALTVKLTLEADSDVTFTWQTADGSATAGSDYTAQAETSVTIPAGDTSATLEVQTTPDLVVEGDETFTASIGADNLPSGVTLGTSTATATIDDDDTAMLRFDPATVTVTEGGTAALTVKLTLEADSDVTFTWQTADGSATAGSDYTAQAETSVTIPAGSTSATLHVQTTPDLVVEGDETFTASISANNLPSGVTLGTSTATATIDDDDTATIGFDPATVTVTEGGSAAFTVKLTKEADSDVTFTWQTADDSATAGSDYTAQAETSVTIAAGDTSATLEVQTTPDSVVEGDETFTASISADNLPDGVTLGTSTATATIDDDDTATLGFDPATVNGDRGRLGDTHREADSGGRQRRHLHVADRRRLSHGRQRLHRTGRDLGHHRRRQTRPRRWTCRPPDLVVEGDETFTASISANNLPSGVTLGTATATATIDDDDTATLGFDPATVTVTEGGTAALTSS